MTLSFLARCLFLLFFPLSITCVSAWEDRIKVQDHWGGTPGDPKTPLVGRNDGFVWCPSAEDGKRARRGHIDWQKSSIDDLCRYRHEGSPDDWRSGWQRSRLLNGCRSELKVFSSEKVYKCWDPAKDSTIRSEEQRIAKQKQELHERWQRLFREKLRAALDGLAPVLDSLTAELEDTEQQLRQVDKDLADFLADYRTADTLLREIKVEHEGTMETLKERFEIQDEYAKRVSDDLDVDVDFKSELGGWRQALETPFDQIEKYDRYVRGVSQFDTHQGVKGLEFPRVMVIVSDDETRGFMFAYDKLFGAKEKSKTDLENEAAGKETTIDRTRRLFYVTCSRAEESLSVVYYAADPALACNAMIRQGWFDPAEIELIG
jgi:superfamily I DNA/RNA helicase